MARGLARAKRCGWFLGGKPAYLKTSNWALGRAGLCDQIGWRKSIRKNGASETGSHPRLSKNAAGWETEDCTMSANDLIGEWVLSRTNFPRVDFHEGSI